MPKIYRVEASQPGCTVRGLWLQANGTPVAAAEVTFLPQHGGIWNGRVISERFVSTTTDKDGRFSIVLAPSSVVGAYRVAVGGQEFNAVVPDSGAVDLADIVKG